MIEAVCREIEARVLPPAKIGLLATDGTLKVGLYHNALEKRNYVPLCPSAEGQRLVMKSIYDGVKAGQLDKAREWIKEPLREMMAQGVKAVILGCTELPLLFEREEVEGVFLIDSTLALAKMAVEFAINKE